MSEADRTEEKRTIHEDAGARQMTTYRPGDVFQIIETHGRAGWVGAFVLTTEVKRWGIQGFVVAIQTHDKQERAFIRLPWDQIEYVGRAPLIPADTSLVEDSANG